MTLIIRRNIMKLRIVIPALILMLVGSVANAVTINTNVGDLNNQWDQ